MLVVHQLPKVRDVISVTNILMATDFTHFSVDGREFARELCHQFKATLHLLHVIQSSTGNLSEAARNLMESREHLEHRFALQQEQTEVKLWAELFPDVKKDFEVKFATRFGVPLTEILNYASEEAVDLIVVGTHGRMGWEHFVSGSIAEHLVRIAPCPVLSVHPLAKPQAADVSTMSPGFDKATAGKEPQK